jgi:hypothetical protein
MVCTYDFEIISPVASSKWSLTSSAEAAAAAAVSTGADMMGRRLYVFGDERDASMADQHWPFSTQRKQSVRLHPKLDQGPKN